MTGRRLTAGQLNRATLARQSLLAREAMDAVTATRRVLALQAQEPASPYLALWNRVADFDPAELDDAFAGSTIVKSSLLRITLHAVHVDDYPHLRSAMLDRLRAARVGDPPFAPLGLTAEAAHALLDDVVEFARTPRTNAEFDAWCAARLGALPKPGLWLRMYAPVVHAATGGAWSFGRRPSYIAARVPHVEVDAAESVQVLARRYLEAFGPASIADLAQFSMVSRAAARAAVHDQADTLVTCTGHDGSELWDVPHGVVPDEKVPAPPRLMAMWDSVLFAYHDRSRVIPAEYRKLIIRNNGDTLPTLLVDGHVAGVWRPVEGGIEASAFHPLSTATWRALEAEADALTAFLAEREPLVYNRYARWWASLPIVEVKVLAG